jgi:hypothetical protein
MTIARATHRCRPQDVCHLQATWHPLSGRAVVAAATLRESTLLGYFLPAPQRSS